MDALSIEHSEETKDDTSKARHRSQKQNHIRFDNHVSVVLIPSRHQYSDRQRRQMWSSQYEIEENAARNNLEFTVEGKDWRNVLDEDSMYVDPSSGNLIHPVHLLPEFHGPEFVQEPTKPLQRTSSCYFRTDSDSDECYFTDDEDGLDEEEYF